jgi:hypothetical protein
MEGPEGLVRIAPGARHPVAGRQPFDLDKRAVNLLETTEKEAACILRNASLE